MCHSSHRSIGEFGSVEEKKSDPAQCPHIQTLFRDDAYHLPKKEKMPDTFIKLDFLFRDENDE